MGSEIIVKPKVEIASEILAQLKTQTEEVGQVILHVIYRAPIHYALIRIWASTYLYDHQSDHRSELVHVENISYAPDWSFCNPGIDNYFTLVFSGLPRDCLMFDFIEHCEGPGAFEILNIPRNETDVYYVKLKT